MTAAMPIDASPPPGRWTSVIDTAEPWPIDVSLKRPTPRSLRAR